MTLIVDGRRDEIRQYAPELDWISNSFGFLGSIPKHNPSKEVNRVSFRGCMKKVRYDIDATRILLVNLADQSYGGSVVKTEGDISYSCKNPSQRSDVLSFTETSSYLTLPRWNSLSSGSLCKLIVFLLHLILTSTKKLFEEQLLFYEFQRFIFEPRLQMA